MTAETLRRNWKQKGLSPSTSQLNLVHKDFCWTGAGRSWRKSMPRRSLLQSFVIFAFLVPSLSAAVIPKLFNSGVDDNGVALPAETKDTHYRLVDSADPDVPGPDTFTLTAGFPVPPWVAESDISRWIAPQAAQGTGNAEGNYTYETTFDLTGFDPATANITGRWSVDNTGTDIVLNGQG